ncbi:hypothetical protein Ddye_024435 [Dipteronia dyeriana]|uniref:RNase H type-1 domain-containing protein n=1 Tax=Dipteronia dyeriana TaxID=168575 RepID=A0AAD9TVC0_9ROSI|nr:hypothetical protein Ddye_024435 [Dipteronia dyeriana]
MVLPWTKEFFQEYQSANEFSGGLEVTTGLEVVKWCPPIDGFYKINTDTTLVGEKIVIGVGAVIQNHLGQVMAYTAQHLEVSVSTKLAEAMAIIWGIGFTVDSSLMPAIIESDALSMVSHINSGSPNHTKLGFICGDIAKYIQDGVIIVVSFVPQKANVVTHTLAKMALSINHDRFWMETFPSCVERLIVEDYPN